MSLVIIAGLFLNIYGRFYQRIMIEFVYRLVVSIEGKYFRYAPRIAAAIRFCGAEVFL
jgi:hypothetical protein